MEIWNYVCNMGRSEFWGSYFVLGLINCLINGFIRKLETHDSPLFGLMWFLLWPFSIIGYMARIIEWTYNKLKSYQPLRRLRIYYLRHF